jgi:hypothetical protein
MAKGEVLGKPELCYVVIGEQDVIHDDCNAVNSSPSVWEGCLLPMRYWHL